MPVKNVVTMAELREKALETPKLTAVLLTIFAALALAVTLAGISGVIASPCTGEPIAYQGSAHMMATFQTTSDGFTVSTHFNSQGISGVGLVTGTKYQIIDAFQEDGVTPLGGMDGVERHLVEVLAPQERLVTNLWFFRG